MVIDCNIGDSTNIIMEVYNKYLKFYLSLSLSAFVTMSEFQKGIVNILGYF